MLAVKIARRQQSVGCLTFRALSSDQHPVLSSFLLLSLFQLASVPIFRGVCEWVCVCFCDVTSLYPNRSSSVRDMALLFISSMLTSVRVFMWLHVGGTVSSHVCKCRCSDVNGLYTCVWACVCVSWLRPLEFPENPDRTHLIATHHIVTPSPRYGTRRAQPALPFPFTLPSSRIRRTFFCFSTSTFFFFFFCRRLHFIGDFFL